MDISDVVTILDRVETEFVGDSVGHSAFHSPARQPGAKALRMVIATGAFRAG